MERQEGRRMTQREERRGEEWCEGKGKAHRRFAHGSSGRVKMKNKTVGVRFD